MPLQHIEIDAADPLAPIVTVGGIRLPALSRVSLDCRENQPPTLYIEARAEGKVEAEGVVVQIADQRQMVIDWLGNLDPKQLEQAMLERGGGFGASETIGESCLAVLREWADGNQ